MSRVKDYSVATMSVVVGLSSVLRATLFYLLEITALFFCLYLSGLKLKRKLDYIKLSIIVTGIASLLELLFSRPTLNLVIISSNIASSISFMIGQTTFRWAIPNVIGASYYFLDNSNALGFASILYIGFIPLLAHGINKVTGINSVGLLRGFLLEDMIGPKIFEKQLESLPLENKELRAHVFLIKQKSRNNKIAIIITDVHPGPFGKVGSSGLINKLKEKLDKDGFATIYLHGVGGHENDMVSSDETEKFVEIIANSLIQIDKLSREVGATEKIICKPSTIETTNFKIDAICLDNKRLIVITAKHKSTDDLPSTLSYLEDKYNVILIDAQNSYMVENTFSHHEEREIEEALVNEILGKEQYCSYSKIGYHFIPSEELDKDGLEIGPLGIRVILIQCNDERTALIVIDGNNMLPRLRSMILENVRDLVSNAEVITTDNHSLVGLRGKRGYRIIGETIDKEELVRKTRWAVKKAIENLDVFEVNYSLIKFKANVLGTRGFDYLKKAVLKTPLAISLYIATLIVLPLLIL